jgi:hypothetical protein
LRATVARLRRRRHDHNGAAANERPLGETRRCAHVDLAGPRVHPPDDVGAGATERVARSRLERRGNYRAAYDQCCRDQGSIRHRCLLSDFNPFDPGVPWSLLGSAARKKWRGDDDRTARGSPVKKSSSA